MLSRSASVCPARVGLDHVQQQAAQVLALTRGEAGGDRVLQFLGVPPPGASRRGPLRGPGRGRSDGRRGCGPGRRVPARRGRPPPSSSWCWLTETISARAAANVDRHLQGRRGRRTHGCRRCRGAPPPGRPPPATGLARPGSPAAPPAPGARSRLGTTCIDVHHPLNR